MEISTLVQTDFEVVAEVINYLKADKDHTFNLNKIADSLQLSIDELDAVFIRWSGRDIKTFLHSLSRESILSKLNGVPEQPSLFNISKNNSLQISKATFAHSDFCDIVPMTAQDIVVLQSQGIRYATRESPFGQLLIASSDKGVCYMAFYEDEAVALKAMKAKFRSITDSFFKGEDELQDHAMAIFSGKSHYPFRIRLHLKGTDFQHIVWKQLLRVPFGSLTTYHAIATQIGKPKAYRAVGTAIAKNWIAYILPCHRIIRAGGDIGQYMWGSTRKNAIIGWEGVK